MACLKRFFDGDKMANLPNTRYTHLGNTQPHRASKSKNVMKQSKIEIDGMHQNLNITQSLLIAHCS